MTPLDADYLVVGAGAMGMAFTDTILTDSADATVVLVDRRGRPGGHWTDAYPFVRLHQPSAFYGVNSRPLGDDAIDATGWNAGLYELASGSEVCAYFDRVLNQRFLPSGRVDYRPGCEYEGDRWIRSILSGESFEVAASATVVDASYMNVVVPSMRAPAYGVDEETWLVPVNGLGSLDAQPERYAIVGAGKTGMDACLYLLANGVDPDSITWIMPRDSWILDRANIQPGDDFASRVMESAVRQTEISAEAATFDELFTALEAEGLLLRIDETVKPTMYRCATITLAEREQLRRIDDVVRLGRVQQIGGGEIHLDEGVRSVPERTLFVDCSADGLARRPVVPVFEPGSITLQSVRTCQQVFSAALIAHVEASYGDVEAKNRLCTVVPHPDSDVDWLRTQLATTLNGIAWRQDSELSAWLAKARLDGFSRHRAKPPRDIARRLLAATGPAVDNLERLLG